MARQLKSFEEARKRDDTLNRLPPRFLPIEVRRIVGSISAPRIAGLTKDFQPRSNADTAPRYQSVYQAMKSDVPLPPIEVYALRGKYYVVDGHNRVGAAHALGHHYIDALVHEFLLPATSAVNRLYNERLHFERMTGLTNIVLTETGQYRKLLSQIREHRFFLGESGQPHTLKSAAADWLEYVYAPTVDLLEASSVPGHFPDRTPADLYVYLCDYKWIKSQNRGMDIGFPKALADFERLYPPRSGASAALSAPLQALRALARPVIGAGQTVLHWAGEAQASDIEEPPDEGLEAGLEARSS